PSHRQFPAGSPVQKLWNVKLQPRTGRFPRKLSTEMGISGHLAVLRLWTPLAYTSRRGISSCHSYLRSNSSPSNASRCALKRKLLSVQDTSVWVTVRADQSPRSNTSVHVVCARTEATSLPVQVYLSTARWAASRVMSGNRSAPLPLTMVTSWVSDPTSRVTVQRFSGVRRLSVRIGAAPAGAPNEMPGSFSRSGRIGRVRKLFAVDTVRRTGRGGGHARGQ